VPYEVARPTTGHSRRAASVTRATTSPPARTRAGWPPSTGDATRPRPTGCGRWPRGGGPRG